jgi:hypothetical protein
MTLTPQEQEAMAWADEVVIYEPGSDKKSGHIKPAILAALVRRLLEREKALTEALGKVRVGLSGFKDCMEAQRTDGPLPPGHDDHDESCGDGVCFKAGATIDDDLAVIDAALSALNPGEKK